VRTLLVTGHTGFVGRIVRDVLHSSSDLGWRFATLPDAFDIRSPDLSRCIESMRPAGVLHLAALTSVAQSFREPERFFDVNFNGTWNLLRALRNTNFDGRLLFVSSGDCYGIVADNDLPVRETHMLRPRSPYAVSKVAAEALCLQWAETEKLNVVLTRSFNHVGPGQDPVFAIAGFAKQIERIRRGVQPARLMTGDLDVTRDLSDVRDVVAAYLALLERGRSGEVYNVGSGHERRIRDVLNEMLAIAGVDAEIVTDQARVRPGEQRRAAADITKIGRDTEWCPTMPLARTLRDMLDDWGRRPSVD